MPGIWNINSVYNVGSKKLSSKLTFEVGEKFAGRVMRISQNKGEFTIKLLDGWQFIAQLDENLTPEQLEGLLKFQVLGFQDGKLKLKLVRQEDKATSEENNPLNALIKSQGLAKEEIETLKQLVKFNIPLTKDNISKYSSIFNFNEKIKLDEKEVDNFINNYISSKNIPIDSEESKSIREKLQSFFKEFKNMKAEDILTFIENDIDLTESNIKAFNRIFKGDESIEKILLKAPVEGNVIEESTSNDVVKNSMGNTYEANNNDLKNIAPKEVYTNSSQEKKISILDMLKKISGDFEEVNNNEKNVNLNLSKEGIKNEIVINKDTIINKNTIINYFKENNINTESLTDKDIEKFIEIVNNKNTDEADMQEYKFKNISFSTTKDVKEFIDILKNQATIPKNDKVDKVMTPLEVEQDEFVQAKELVKDVHKATPEIIKEGIKAKALDIKDIIKEVILSSKNGDDEGEAFNKVIEFIKGNAAEVKVFNSVSNNYYYMNIPLKVKQDEYECKLIVKDERGKGKKLDSSNVKMIVSVKTLNLGNVDAYIKLQNKNLDIDLKCSKEYVKILDKEKNKLIESLNTIGYNSKVIVSRAIEEVNISTSREFFNSTNLVILDRKV
ncbi:flagellar hook-length control protein FliK [Clostridium intestinale]|uniref:flagellar hook-length control protein FliK n=1 Tax=Clostridium intestinale TaxID=36845 RepID=UPI002DD6397E|nr:flagellar hook-length control protein FliK [Clostridium intestinale]WRY51638.1 flagellar hook-length control protein FliK [Clostridium intestinale]